ncbi:MAG TPA: NIPSNAP family protein [Burkholderiaceae bacterium]
METTLAPPRTATPLALEDCAVIELRDYTLHPGRLDELITLFEREFIEAQEAAGMRVIAQFRDLDRPDHFVWLRGFADMTARRQALEGFYGGATWATHRAAANATMIDSDDVRLLRPAKPSWALATPATPRAHRDAEPDILQGALFVLTLCALQVAPYTALRRWFEREALPVLRDAGAMPIAVMETESALNDYPRLPVRTDEQLFAWITRAPSTAAWAQAEQRLQASRPWRDEVLPRLQRCATRAPITLRLQPTVRSLLR